ncbi:MAG TPA: Holliday junction branch migration protein RuvA [Terriglobales bacterium]|nr:Holliday junction branch migration protein RuvA [Terriglobales bacterium]
MIAYLNGVVRERHAARVVLEVHGVGYELQVPTRTFQQLPAPGAAAAVFVHTHVREDAIQLFGFAAAAERELFERLIAVNGVGPKMGLAILSVLAPDDLARAVQSNDLARLTTIPGVGKKTAERLVIELRDKLPAVAPGAAAAVAITGAGEDVLSALVNLGYAPAPAAQAVQRALQKHPDAGFDQLFTACMKAL